MCAGTAISNSRMLPLSSVRLCREMKLGAFLLPAPGGKKNTDQRHQRQRHHAQDAPADTRRHFDSPVATRNGEDRASDQTGHHQAGGQDGGQQRPARDRTAAGESHRNGQQGSLRQDHDCSQSQYGQPNRAGGVL